jgi:gliding motility-associatede transport system auxiliary component
VSDLRKHAPDSKRSPLGIMALISLLLGALFLLGYKFGAVADMDVATEAEQRRLDFLFWAGWFLLAQGVGIGLFHIARDPHFATGVDDGLRAKLQDAPLWLRVVYLPRVVLGHRRARGFANTGVQITLALTLFVLANYLFARHELWRIDVTQSQQFTLSDESLALIKDTKTPIRLLTVVPEEGMDPQLLRQLRTLVQEYREANSWIEGEFFDVLAVKDPIEREEKLKALGVSGDLSNDQALMGVIVQYGKREPGKAFEVVRSKRVTLEELFQRDPGDPTGRRVAFNGEQAITTAILELSDERKATIYFLEGHGEPEMGAMGPGGLAYWVQRIRERNMQVKSLNLLREDQIAVPEDADLLVVAGPQSPLTKDEVKAIDAYLGRGGDLIYLAEPRYESTVTGVEWLAIGLRDMFRRRYGILIKDAVVSFAVQDNRGRTVRTADLQGVFEFSHRHPLVRPLQHGRIHLRGARHFAQVNEATNIVTEPLLENIPSEEKRYRAHDNPGSVKGSGGPFVFAMASHAHDSTGKTGPKVPSRVVLVGDVDMATSRLVSQRSAVNLEFLMNSVQWCLERQSRIVGKVRVKEPTRLVMTKDQIAQVSLIAIFGLPAIAIALGIVAWAIRRRT